MRTLKLALLCAIGLGLCLNPALAESRKVGLLLKGRTPFWNAVEQGAMAAAAEHEVELIVKYPPTESDVGIQVQMLNALAAQKVECIILVPTNADTLALPAAAIAVNGVKFVVIDSPLNGKTASVFIGTDHKAAGEAAGRLLATLVKDSAKVSVLRHAQGNLVTAAREDSAIAILKSAQPSVTVFSDVFLGNVKEEQAERAQLLLTKHPDVQAVLASSTPGTMALLDILAKSAHPGAIKLVGFGYNLTEATAAGLAQGTLHGWIAQLPREMGRVAVESARALLDGKEVPPVIHTPFEVITPANLQDPRIQALKMP
jgi:ribose transport system substrate-binding protein